MFRSVRIASIGSDGEGTAAAVHFDHLTERARQDQLPAVPGHGEGGRVAFDWSTIRKI